MSANLIIAYQYWEGDKEQLERVLNLICDIGLAGGSRGFDLVLFRRNDASRIEDHVIERLKQVARSLRDYQSLSRESGWPAGCNGLWHNLMTNIRSINPNASHVATFEADTVPVVMDWFEQLRDELDDWKGIGALLGAPVVHYNGNAVWPADLTSKLVPRAYGTPSGQSWDTYWYPLFKDHMRPTEKIVSDHNSKTMAKSGFDQITKGGKVAILHGVKDDSVEKFVRKKLLTRSVILP